MSPPSFLTQFEPSTTTTKQITPRILPTTTATFGGTTYQQYLPTYGLCPKVVDDTPTTLDACAESKSCS